jgi:hypothetical protein
VGCNDALKRRIVIDMLTTPRAIVLAALLVCLAALAHAAFPRYQVETLRADAGVFTRMDRWRGTMDVRPCQRCVRRILGLRIGV